MYEKAFLSADCIAALPVPELRSGADIGIHPLPAGGRGAAGAGRPVPAGAVGCPRRGSHAEPAEGRGADPRRGAHGCADDPRHGRGYHPGGQGCAQRPRRAARLDCRYRPGRGERDQRLPLRRRADGRASSRGAGGAGEAGGAEGSLHLLRPEHLRPGRSRQHLRVRRFRQPNPLRQRRQDGQNRLSRRALHGSVQDGPQQGPSAEL